MNDSKMSYCKHWLYSVVMSLSSVGAIAVEANATPVPSTAAMSQVTAVSQLADVQPSDWAFQALQSLSERYACITGNPNAAYRGDRALTRYEFAAGLNNCLVQISRYITEETTNLVAQEDLATLQRLTEEFTTELTAIQSQVGTLEIQTAELEANQFSTTTQLSGEVIFAATGILALLSGGMICLFRGLL